MIPVHLSVPSVRIQNMSVDIGEIMMVTANLTCLVCGETLVPGEKGVCGRCISKAQKGGNNTGMIRGEGRGPMGIGRIG